MARKLPKYYTAIKSPRSEKLMKSNNASAATAVLGTRPVEAEEFLNQCVQVQLTENKKNELVLTIMPLVVFEKITVRLRDKDCAVLNPGDQMMQIKKMEVSV